MKLIRLFFILLTLGPACKPFPPSVCGPRIIFNFFEHGCDSVLTSTHQNLAETINFFESQRKAEAPFINSCLINIKRKIPSIRIDLRYSSTNNFMQSDMYGAISNAYLQPDAVEKLEKAQAFLKQKYPLYSLIIFDAARSKSVQQLMWDSVKISKMERTKYLSNPQSGSLHNYGEAVDIGVCDSVGNELDMGTPFDFFGEEAQPEKEISMIQQGKLTHAQVKNRQLLREVMYKAGFFNIQTEWWHFNACTLQKAASTYPPLQ